MSVKESYRFASEADAAALLAIYAAYLDTGITFETVLPDEEEFRARIREISAEYPYLVCEREGRIVGYAYAHRVFARAAYRWDAELSVYLAPEARGEGLGERLYRRLIALLRLQGVQTVYAVVTSPNPASDRLHARMGFVREGYFRNSGYKNGVWYAVSWYALPIGGYEDPPAELRGIGEIPPRDREAALAGG